MSTLRLSAVALALLALAPAAHAQDKAQDKRPTRFSIGLGVGIRPDMAGLGSTIVQDGSVDLADTTLASLAYSTDKALMSDRNNMTLKANSDNTDSIFNVLSKYEEGGSLLGGEIGGDLRYEFDELIDFPVFLKAGFYYTGRIAGGEQSRTLGDIVEQSSDLSALAFLGGFEPSDLTGGTMVTRWNAAWIEVPISVGIKVPVRPHTFAYGSAGVSIFSGGFDIGIDVDEKYANVLNTHIIEDEEATFGYRVIDQSPDSGGVSDTIKFRTGAVGLNYGLGVQAGIGKRVAVFVELNQSGAAKTVFAQELGEGTKKLLTSASSATLADDSSEDAVGDSAWFDQIAYPVVMQGASGRLGIRAYLF
jgi:hypothetical protein